MTISVSEMHKETLIENIDKIHTTEMGVGRIQRNLGIDDEPVSYCISKLKKEYSLLFPYDAQSMLNTLYKNYSVTSAEYIDEGVLVKAILDEKGKGMYSRYIKEDGDING